MPCSWIGRIDILKTSTTQSNLQIHAIPIEIPMRYFTELEQTFHTFMWNHRRPPIAMTTLGMDNITGITPPGIKLYYKAIVIKTAWHWHKNRHMDQWNRTESPEINPQFVVKSHLAERGKNLQQGKDSLFTKWHWENWTNTCQKITPLSDTTHENKLKVN
ncbi:hypothetical protein HJG60_008533 [Phyllostomus discolor]|uniref:Uncharacterized protein n=1 Tax=Phyllostomus discolor TaxID=89673 RepID=A0A833Z0Z2_9CHIR|nr:hypothetical protein HJG60_008533 [Phyllostomus discolor]